MAPKIKTLKIQGQEYDLFVEKDWQANNPNALSYIKNRTHYFEPIENTRTKLNVSESAYELNTAEDLIGIDSQIIDSIGTATLSYRWSKEALDLKKLITIKDFKDNNNVALVVEIEEFSKQLQQPALVRLLFDQTYIYKVAGLGAVLWNGIDGICRFALDKASDLKYLNTLTVRLGTTTPINPAYLPVDSESIFINPQGQLTFSWEPSEALSAKIKEAVKAVLTEEEDTLHDWKTKDIKGEHGNIVCSYSECSICGKKKF